METKKNLWGCPPSKKKRSSEKDSRSLNQSSSDDHANLATSLIKFVKKRFTVSRRNRPPAKEKKHPTKTKAKTATASYKKLPVTNLLTLQDWMSTDMTAGSSGEFHVFHVASYKKIHPSFDHNRSNQDVNNGKISRKKSCNMDQMLENLISVDCGGPTVVVEGGSSPLHQSSGDTSKKRVRFRLPLVTNIYVLESPPDLKEGI